MLDVHPDSLWGSLFMHSEWGRLVWMIRRASPLGGGFLRLEIVNTSTGASSEVLIKIGKGPENSVDFDQQVCRRWIILTNHFGIDTSNSWADFANRIQGPIKNDWGYPLRRASEATTLSSGSPVEFRDSFIHEDLPLERRRSLGSVPQCPVKPRGAGELCRR